MCGILGMVGDRWLADFDRALDCLSGRGPDDRDVWHEGPVHLGHRRLEIIDAKGGHQPMASPDGRYRLTYNGEIYNFPQLRAELEKSGVVFRTRSDTEVLLHALIHWGPQRALPRLDGMYAFGLWDRQEELMWLARDRVGIKPLFYSLLHGELVFASTLRPFLELNGFPRRLHGQAVREYLAAGFIPAPLSIMRDVIALEPGCFLCWQPNKGIVQHDHHWRIPGPTATPMQLEELVEATDETLARSTKQQMVSDVPLGVFLSGGIDSSLLVAYMAQASSQPVRTFTVRFDQSARHDESWAARAVAEAFGCEHHELPASEFSAPDLARAVEAMDQPFPDQSFLPLTQLCQLACSHIKVAIGGDGGDELFGGYYRYKRDLHRYPPRAGYTLLRRMTEAGMLPASLYRNGLRGDDRVRRNFSRMDRYPVTTRALSSILTELASDWCRVNEALDTWEHRVRQWSGRMDADSLMRADIWYYLSENCLVKTDRASMMHSLEVRVPILGNAMLDLALPQPATVKMQGERKAVLKTLARRMLPAAVWDRGKHGFSVPLSYYVRDAWKPMGEDLFARAAQIAPFLDAHEVQHRWAQEQAGRRVDWPLFAVLVLLAWLDRYPLEMSDSQDSSDLLSASIT